MSARPAAAPTLADPFGVAVGDWAAGRRAPLHLRGSAGRLAEHDLGVYFAPLTRAELWLMTLAAGLVVDVGCGPARHARHLQAAGLRAVGLDRSAGALATATALGLRLAVRADATAGPLPAGFGTALLLDGNVGMGGSPAGAAALLARLGAAAGEGARLLVGGRGPRPGGPAWRRLVLRAEYLGAAGPWFDWLVPGLPWLTGLARAAGWRAEHAVEDGAGYLASFRLDRRPRWAPGACERGCSARTPTTSGWRPSWASPSGSASASASSRGSPPTWPRTPPAHSPGPPARATCTAGPRASTSSPAWPRSRCCWPSCGASTRSCGAGRRSAASPTRSSGPPWSRSWAAPCCSC